METSPKSPSSVYHLPKMKVHRNKLGKVFIIWSATLLIVSLADVPWVPLMSPKGGRTTPLKTVPDMKHSSMEDKIPDDSFADSESGMYCEYYTCSNLWNGQK